jgi:hypothetical protein
MPLHLACQNNHDEVVLRLFVLVNLFFTSLNLFLLVSKIMNNRNLCDFLQLCKYNAKVVCIKGRSPNKNYVKACSEFGINDPMKMYSKFKTRMKIDYKNKDIIIVLLSNR